MRVFQKKQLFVSLSVISCQLLSGLANGEPARKKRRLDYFSYQTTGNEAQHLPIASEDAGKNQESNTIENIPGLSISSQASLGEAIEASQNTPPQPPNAHIFDFYDYENEENDDPYVGPKDAYFAGVFDCTQFDPPASTSLTHAERSDA